MRTIRLAVGIGIVAGIIAFVYLTAGAIVTAFAIIGQFVGGVILVALPYAGWIFYRRERHREFRVIDGSLPMQRVKLPSGEVVLVDMNKLPVAACVVGPHVGYKEIESALGPQVQMALNHAVQHTRSLAALAPGDDAIIRTRGAVEQPRLPASVVKKLSAPSKPEQKTPAATPSRPAPHLVADTGPRPTRLAIGEDPNSGKVIAWDLELHPFARIHGATQSGKTSLARLLVAQALRHGFEVVILDRRRGKDWGVFRNRAMLIDARESAVLIAALEEEVARYGERDALLGRHGAPNLSALARRTGQVYRRRLFVIEELGTQTLTIKSEGRDVYRRFIRNLRKLTAEAGATGIHGLYIDQIPDAWDSVVRYNCGAIVFRLSDYGGRVAGYPMAHKLAPHQCHYDGKIVNAGHLTDDQLRRTIDLSPVPVHRETRNVLTGGEQSMNRGDTNTLTNSVGTNQEAAQKFIVANPKAGVNALARHLAGLVDRVDEWRNYQSEASRWWHTYNQRGNNYQE